MTIPYAKAEAVGNDFLIAEWPVLAALGVDENELPTLAQAICDRYCGVGADGLEVVYGMQGREGDYFLRIFNSDGSEAEISGNGTRCVAAFLIAERAAREPMRLATKAGVKTLRLIERREHFFVLEMTMGSPQYRQEEVGGRLDLPSGPRTATLIDVGNPQCVLFVDSFDFDWHSLGRQIETHPRFPNRTNVSFVNVIDEHTIDVRFWERGAGATLSSGTGSTGAAVAAVLGGSVKNPIRVVTQAGDLRLRWEDEVILEGPAQLVAKGEFYWRRG